MRGMWRFVMGAIVFLFCSRGATACATCFGAADSMMTHGMNNGILTLLGVIGGVQVGFVALFWNLRKRSKRLREVREGFRLLEGGAK